MHNKVTAKNQGYVNKSFNKYRKEKKCLLQKSLKVIFFDETNLESPFSTPG